jgi:hypothetical protein
MSRPLPIAGALGLAALLIAGAWDAPAIESGPQWILAGLGVRGA